MQGIYLCLQQLETGRTDVENQYARAVSSQGNQSAQQLSKVFQVTPRTWRGLGNIEQSGLSLQAAYRYLDAQRRFSDQLQRHDCVILADADCISGLVLQGQRKPT